MSTYKPKAGKERKHKELIELKREAKSSKGAQAAEWVMIPLEEYTKKSLYC